MVGYGGLLAGEEGGGADYDGAVGASDDGVAGDEEGGGGLRCSWCLYDGSCAGREGVGGAIYYCG